MFNLLYTFILCAWYLYLLWLVWFLSLMKGVRGYIFGWKWRRCHKLSEWMRLSLLLVVLKASENCCLLGNLQLISIPLSCRLTNCWSVVKLLSAIRLVRSHCDFVIRTWPLLIPIDSLACPLAALENYTLVVFNQILLSSYQQTFVLVD